MVRALFPLLLAGATAAPAPARVKKEEAPVRVLMVVSGARSLELADGSAMAIGYWASEVRVPYEALRTHGYEVVIATPGGVVPAPDPHSLPADAAAERKRLDGIEG